MVYADIRLGPLGMGVKRQWGGRRSSMTTVFGYLGGYTFPKL